jgi:hypothetical protein
MAGELVQRWAIMVVVRRFPSMGAAGSRPLRYGSYARMKEFAVYIHIFPSVKSWGLLTLLRFIRRACKREEVENVVVCLTINVSK